MDLVAQAPLLGQGVARAQLELVPDKVEDLVSQGVAEIGPKAPVDRRTAQFTLSAEFSDGEISYQTMLSAEYRLNSAHWQSIGLGIAVTGLGMLAGGFIGRAKVIEGAKR